MVQLYAIRHNNLVERKSKLTSLLIIFPKIGGFSGPFFFFLTFSLSLFLSCFSFFFSLLFFTPSLFLSFPFLSFPLNLLSTIREPRKSQRWLSTSSFWALPWWGYWVGDRCDNELITFYSIWTLLFYTDKYNCDFLMSLDSEIWAKNSIKKCTESLRNWCLTWELINKHRDEQPLI